MFSLRCVSPSSHSPPLTLAGDSIETQIKDEETHAIVVFWGRPFRLNDVN
jgi:hypothetical protein